MTGFKIAIRSWLIDLVREAIRIERVAESARIIRQANRITSPKPASKPLTVEPREPSFEQMEAEALKSQEKYYEPERL